VQLRGQGADVRPPPPSTGRWSAGSRSSARAADGRWAINIQNASTGNRVLNNILLTSHTFRGDRHRAGQSPRFVSDANAVTPRFTLDGGGSVLALTAWRQATGQDLQSFGTPATLFVDTAAGDYHLRADAPARDTALAPTDVVTDFDGEPRPLGRPPTSAPTSGATSAARRRPRRLPSTSS
jgi:hypothetical protein